MSTISVNKKDFLLLSSTSTTSEWSSLSTGANSRVLSIVSNDSTNDIYAGGLFTYIGGVFANRVAKWDGTGWSSLGSGLDGSVSSMVMNGNDLYVGGSFTTAGGISANNIAKWNGSAWSSLGSGLNGSVSAMVINGTDIYVGGFFTTAGGISANYVAKWNGSNWSVFTDTVTGITGANAQVLTMTVDLTGNLWIGGNFSQAGGKTALFISKWNGSTWFGFNVNTFNAVPYSMTVDNLNNLYVGGSFTQVLQQGYPAFTANYIAKYSGGVWYPITVNGVNGVGNAVEEIIYNNNKLYVAGDFTTAGDINTGYIAVYDGTSWNNLNSTFNTGVATIMIKSNLIYVGGLFTSPFYYISKYSEQTNKNTYYLPLLKKYRKV